MELDWNDLTVLGALARGGSVAGAARVLSVDASTVSRRLAALEEALGAQLVVRGGREIAWTAEGRLALAAAERVEEQIGELGRAIRAAKTGVAGTVRVTCTPATVLHLSPLAARARELHPELRVEIAGQLAVADLAKGEADVALRSAKPTAADLVARRGVDVGWYLVASTSYAERNGLPVTEGELAAHPMVLYAASMSEVAGPRWAEEHGRGGPGALRLDSPDAVTYAIASGAGLGVIPYPSMHGRADLVRVFPDAVAWNHLWIVYHQTQRDSARVRAVVDLLVRHLEDEARCYTGRPT